MPQWIKLEPVSRQVVIAGQVTDSQTGRAVSGARVELQTMPESFKARLALKALQHQDSWDSKLERPDRTHTAIDGSFYFIDLPSGSYTLTASLPDQGTRYDVGQAQVEVSRSDGQIQQVAIALPSTTLKGQITNLEKAPLTMAKVQVAGSGEATFSDSEGNYLFTGLQASKQVNSERTVSVSAQGYSLMTKTVQLSQGEVKSLNFELQRKQPGKQPDSAKQGNGKRT